MRRRNGVSFVTLRAWRKSVKARQIEALKTLKKKPSNALARQVALELRRTIENVIGASAFDAVVPMPCGHSAPEACLSALIAQELGRQLRLPVVEALSAQRIPGSSHPRSNLDRPPMTLARPAGERVLLVDDVATSGRHIEEAVTLLRHDSQAVFSIAWISGVVAD